MSNDDRTNVADAFLQEIYSRGYTPMFYASASHLTGNSRWNTSTLENNYKIGKSGVNHHFIKINNLVKRHKERSEDNGSKTFS